MTFACELNVHKKVVRIGARCFSCDADAPLMSHAYLEILVGLLYICV